MSVVVHTFSPSAGKAEAEAGGVQGQVSVVRSCLQTNYKFPGILYWREIAQCLRACIAFVEDLNSISRTHVG